MKKDLEEYIISMLQARGKDILNHFIEDEEYFDSIRQQIEDEKERNELKSDCDKLIDDLINIRRDCYIVLDSNIDEYMRDNYAGYRIIDKDNKEQVKELKESLNDVERNSKIYEFQFSKEYPYNILRVTL